MSLPLPQCEAHGGWSFLVPDWRFFLLDGTLLVKANRYHNDQRMTQLWVQGKGFPLNDIVTSYWA